MALQPKTLAFIAVLAAGASALASACSSNGGASHPDAAGMEDAESGSEGDSGDRSDREVPDGEFAESGNGGNPEAGEEGGGEEGGVEEGGVVEGGSEGGVASGQPILCPEKTPFSPTLANSVQVNDAALSKNTHWTANKVWLVMTSLDVDTFTLTIDAGTTVCFVNNSTLSVGEVNPGQINVMGTAAAHVTFTSSSSDGKTPDFFGGLMLNLYKASTISYLDIFYGGMGGGGAAFAFDLTTASGSRFLVDHLTIAEVQSEGIHLGVSDFKSLSGLDPASVIEFDGYYKQNADSPPLLPAVQADILATDSLTPTMLSINAANIPAASAAIVVDPSPGPVLNSSLTWNDLGLPYQLSDVDVFGGGTVAKAVNFTINAGVTVQLTGNIILGDILTQSYGNLIVKGSAKKPVVFTSAQAKPAAGDWGSVFFLVDGFDPATSSIDHAEFHFGGGSDVDNTIFSCTNGDQGQGEVGIGGAEGAGSFTGPPITNAVFTDSLQDGIRAGDDPTDVTMDFCTTDYSGDGNTFTNVPGSHFPPLNPTTCM